MIKEFLEVTRAVYSDQITDTPLREFFDGLRPRGLEERTVQNNRQFLGAFLKFCGVNATGMLKTDTEGNRPSAPGKHP